MYKIILLFIAGLLAGRLFQKAHFRKSIGHLLFTVLSLFLFSLSAGFGIKIENGFSHDLLLSFIAALTGITGSTALIILAKKAARVISKRH